MPLDCAARRHELAARWQNAGSGGGGAAGKRQRRRYRPRLRRFHDRRAKCAIVLHEGGRRAAKSRLVRVRQARKSPLSGSTRCKRLRNQLLALFAGQQHARCCGARRECRAARASPTAAASDGLFL